MPVLASIPSPDNGVIDLRRGLRIRLGLRLRIRVRSTFLHSQTCTANRCYLCRHYVIRQILALQIKTLSVLAVE